MAASDKTYTITDVCNVLNADFFFCNDKHEKISQILIDSRKLISADQVVFFAIKSSRNDGHIFINELFNKGVKNFIVSDVSNINIPQNEANILLVPDTLKSLQLLAAYHRKRFNIPILAITGSNGKTIVKEWLFQLLSEDIKVVRSPKSYNSQIGVPLSVWQIEPDDELGIFEAGISEPGEMENLVRILNPDIGIFTNIGQAHDHNFLNIAQKIGEKLKLFTKAKTLIFCSDYPEIQEIIIKSELLKSINLFSWGLKKGGGLFVENIVKKQTHTQITAQYINEIIDITIPFIDNASVENAIHCWCYMLLQNYDREVIRQRMLKLANVAMRLELKEGINNCSIINDSYNSDINSLTIALDFLKQQNQHPKKSIILSDILQSGKNDADLYEEVAHMISDVKIDRIIGIGKSIYKQAHLFRAEKTFYQTTEEFINAFPFSEFQNETILLKGARDFEFEKIVSFLQQKTHKTTLEINLNAILNNLNYFKSKLNNGVKVMAMVKAFSYGNGSFEIANVLQYNHVNYLGVAFSDEGKALRKAGITLPIMVMSPDESSFDDMIKYKLEPEIYSFRIFELFLDAFKRNISNNTFKIHLKLDTGMHRLGFEAHQIDELGKRLREIDGILQVASVFTHLAASDNNNHDEFTHSQVGLYNEMCLKLEEYVGNSFIRHVVNSAGIIRFPMYHFDMIRLGLGLYGIISCDDEQKNIENVSVLRSSISQIKTVKQNETVGYDRSGKANKDMVLATVPIGYADGLSRRLSNGKGKMKVNGKLVPIFGNVCMDMCMIDITDVSAKEGDEVIIFDNQYTISDMAKATDTIPYEILTSFSRRIKRVYFQE